MGSRASRFLLCMPLLGALAVAACTPIAPSLPPPPPTPTSIPGCGETEVPTPSNPVDYVAVVDTPGPSTPDVVTFTADSEGDKNAQLDHAKQGGTIVAVDQQQPVSALAVDPSNDPQFPNQYGLVNSGFTAAWANGFDGTGVTIAILDTGIQANHEDLNGTSPGKVLPGADFVTGSAVDSYQGNSNFGTIDYNGHGTHVAGIAAADDNAVGGLGGAPGATLMSVRVLDQNGSGFTSNVVSGIYYAVNHGAKVISMSLGGAGCSSTEHAAVDYAEANGAIVVAAAGNDSSSTPIYPAGFGSAVIAVGATTSANAMASYSNFGSPYVDLGAPGSSVLSTLNGPGISSYGYKSGTSMATPFVSAAAALVLQKCPAITNGNPNGGSVKDKVMSLLQSTASPVIPGMGASLVQAGAATASTVACPA
jgi:subtilisin family serine protease